MRTSGAALFPAHYDAAQTTSAVEHVAQLDPLLLEDGTYFVHEISNGAEIVACGGWSRRHKLFAGEGDAADDDRQLDPATEAARMRAMFVREDWTRRGIGKAILESCVDAARSEGFRELVLVATLPGVPLYAAFGFLETRRLDVVTPDGVVLAGASMRLAI